MRDGGGSVQVQLVSPPAVAQRAAKNAACASLARLRVDGRKHGAGVPCGRGTLPISSLQILLM